MGERRWRMLSDEQRAILEQGVAVWEHALETELRAAEISGEAVGREHGIVYTDPPPADVKRFLEGYDRYAGHSAQMLSRFGIDGVTTYRHAREVVAHSALHGRIVCSGGAT